MRCLHHWDICKEQLWGIAHLGNFCQGPAPFRGRALFSQLLFSEREHSPEAAASGSGFGILMQGAARFSSPNEDEDNNHLTQRQPNPELDLELWLRAGGWCILCQSPWRQKLGKRRQGMREEDAPKHSQTFQGWNRSRRSTSLNLEETDILRKKKKNEVFKKGKCRKRKTDGPSEHERLALSQELPHFWCRLSLFPLPEQTDLSRDKSDEKHCSAPVACPKTGRSLGGSPSGWA